MANKGTEIVPIGVPEVTEGIGLGELRKQALVDGGLLSPRQRYKSLEEKKKARKERGKSRRKERRDYLIGKGLVTPREKLTKEEKRTRAKGRRRTFNQMLRENAELAQKMGIDVSRRRV